MASLTSPSSPTSLQLRFGRRSRGPPSVSLWIRSRGSDRSIRLISAARAQAAGGGRGGSWSGADASPDSFAGWSGPESGDGGGDSQKKGRFGGVLGAGLAGVFFAAGVTFASLSLFSRTTSGVKQQLEPLTTEQEVSLTSDDRSVKVDPVANESNAVLPDKGGKNDYDSGCGTGINKDPFPPIEIIDNATDDGLDNIHHLETSSGQNTRSTDNGVDTIHKASDQVDLHIGPDANNILVPTNSNSSSPEFSAYDAVEFSSDASSFKDSHSTTTSSGTPDSVIRHDTNLGTVNHVDVSSYSTDSTNHTTDHQEGNLSPEETVSSEVLLDFSSGFEGKIPSEPIPSRLITPESSEIVGSNIKDVVESAASISKVQDIEHDSLLQLPTEASTLLPVVHDINEPVPSEMISGSDFDTNEPPKLPSETIDSAEGHKLNESAPSIAYSVSVLSDLNGNVSDISSQSQIGRSLSFESLLSERTFSYAGIPAPSLVSAALQVPPGKVLVPAVVDQVQGQALAALQVLKVIEADVQPGDLCTRREYARWLVAASSALSRNTVSKVYPAMYIENVTELAFDDVTPDDPDFSCIQGLAEAGIISSKLSRSDLDGSSSEQHDSFLFSPESPLSRQDIVSWKMALEKRQLPEVDRNDLYWCSGYIDIDKINPDAWPALVTDLSAGEQGITALAFGYTRLFQPNKPVTKAQAAIALATGDAAEVVGEELTRIEAESLAESAVNEHTALVAQVEKDLNMSFEKELAKEREKIDAVEKLAEEARLELERLRGEREEENNALIRGRAAVESEMEVLSRLRHEVEEQLQELISNKMEISFERDRINKLRKEAESENQVIVQLQYELEVERKALSMARAWAEEEAKRAREQARALEESRDRWERHGIKVVVDADLQDDASTGITWISAGEQSPVVETISRAESLVEKLRAMAAEIKGKSSDVIEKIIQKIVALISALKQWACEASKHAKELHSAITSEASRSVKEFREKAYGFGSEASRSMEEFWENASRFGLSVGDKTRRVVEDCKEIVDKITQKFKSE